MPGPGLPILLLDVDGVLIPYGLTEAVSGPADGDLEIVDYDGLLNRVDPRHGTRLLGLDCELVWATAQEQEPNEEISPKLGCRSCPSWLGLRSGDGRDALEDARAGRLRGWAALHLA